MKYAYFVMAVIYSTLSCGYSFAEDTGKNKGNNDILVGDKIVVTTPPESSTSPTVESAKEKINQIAGSVSVVDSEDYKNSNAVTVKDMLAYTPGVLAQSRINHESRLSIRGTGLSRTFHLRGLNLYQDNIPLNSTDGSADFQDTDPLSLKYIEVYKGANATSLGTASLGGAINYVTPTGYNADKISTQLSGGSFGTLQGNLSSGQVIGKNDYFFSMSNVRSDGFRDFSDMNNLYLVSNIGHKFNNNLESRMYFNYTDANQELPGNLTKAQLDADPKQANGFNKANNWQRDFDLYRIANKTTWQTENVKIDGGLYAQQKDLYHPIFVAIDQKSHEYGSFLGADITGNIAGYKNQLLLGNTLAWGETDNKWFVNNNGAYGFELKDEMQTSKTATFYVENRFHPTDKLSLSLGTQFIHTIRELDDNYPMDGNQGGEKTYNGLSPKIGALYNVTPDIQFFTNLSMAYEPPTFSEVSQNSLNANGLNDINAQKSTTLEIGTRGTVNKINWDASIYHAWLKDEFMIYDLGGGQSATTNADKTFHQGLELGADATLFDNIISHNDNLNLRIAYTYSNFKFDGDRDYGDNDIPGAPKHHIRSEVKYQHPSGFYLAPNIEAVPQGYYVDMANTLKSDSYILFGMNVGYDITDKVTLFVDARNLADKKYAATTNVVTTINAFNSNVFAPGEGRSVFGGLKVKF